MKVQQPRRQLDILPNTLLRFLANYILDSQRRSCCKSPSYWWVCFGPIPISFTRALSATQETVGFKHVDAHVTDVMITWIGSVMQKTCHELVEEAREAKVSNRVATSNIEDLSDGSQLGVFWLRCFCFRRLAVWFAKWSLGENLSGWTSDSCSRTLKICDLVWLAGAFCKDDGHGQNKADFFKLVIEYGIEYGTLDKKPRCYCFKCLPFLFSKWSGGANLCT